LEAAPSPFTGTHVYTLPNGFRVILKSDPTIPVVAMQVWARCGALDETPNIHGISHGLEHMVFKGTPTRSAGEITRAIESNGGAINAATQLETTHYYIDIPSRNASKALDVLADTLLHPTFPQDELERERRVIVEEIHRRDDSPDATLWDEFISHVFHPTPYGTLVIGSEQTVLGLTREDLFSYFRKHYIPSRLCLVIAGDFKIPKVLAQVENLFGSLAPAESFETRMPETLTPRPAETAFLKKPVQLTYFAAGFPTVGLGHPDMVSLDVFADMLGGGVSSRLFQRLREEKQLVYSVSADFIPFRLHGLFAFFGETDRARQQRALAEIERIVADIEAHPFTPEELSRAKARIRSEWLHGSETPHGRANTLGSLASLGKLDLINNYLATLSAVSLDNIMDVYRRHIRGQELHTTMLVPSAAQ
jgi:zinc protease